MPNGLVVSRPSSSSSLSSYSSVLSCMPATRGLAWFEARDKVLSRLTMPLPLPLFLPPACRLDVKLARLICIMEELLQSFRSMLPNLTSLLPLCEFVRPCADALPSLIVDSSVG